MCSCIALGLLQILSMHFSKRINWSIVRYLRKPSKEIVSEATMACHLRKSIFHSLGQNKDLSITRIIKSKQGDLEFGRPEATMEEVVSAAKKACCHEFIMDLPEGYDTVIGEGGGSLSGGEKQRISIARAILKDVPIIILDEATSSLDPENEQQLQRAIEELTKSKTIIMIAHRLATVRNADNIVVLNEGKIAQQGKHEELMKQKGIYSEFIQVRKKAIAWNL